MKCKNCGTELNTDGYCPNCGNKTDNKKSNKKIIIIGICLVLVVCVFLIYKSTAIVFKISNIKDNYTYDELVKEKLVLKTKGSINSEETVWNLNGYDITKGSSLTNYDVVNGENVLIITNNNKTKKYTFNVSNTNGIVASENLTVPIDDADFDGDGIPNSVEKEMGLATYTNDTDGDGLFDNVEIVMGLDPLVKDNYDEVRTYKVTQDNTQDAKIYINVSGKGNVANTFLDTEELDVGFDNSFVKSDVVVLSSSNNEKPEKMEIHFVTGGYKNLDNYAIYEYNSKTQELSELETFTDEEGLYANIAKYYDYLFLGSKSNKPASEYNNQIMFVVDNSGSMFSAEYVMAKENRTIKEGTSDEYGNDVDFKRISLMQSLVDKLGTENFTYSTMAFTSNMCKITDASKDSELIKNGLESLKTDCQVFNGTDMSGAIRNNYRSFDMTSPGIKYMIVLTDGIDKGLFNYALYDYELKNIKKAGVKVITIGLGSSVNSEYLQKISTSTNGKYLYASDANMLDTLINIITDDIQSNKLTLFDDKEFELVADSGFEITRDGFSIENFSSKDSPGGNCYGFSNLAKQIYLNKLPESASEEKTLVSNWLFGDDSTLIAYTLTHNNKKRLVKGNTYNIQLHKDYNYFLNLKNVPDDYRYIANDNLPHISEKYRTMAINLGYEPFMKNEKVELTIDGKKGTYDSYESIGYLNLFNATPASEYKDDYQLLQLINRGFRIQGNNISNLIAQKIQHDGKKNISTANEFKILSKEIDSGSPAYISLLTNMGGHSVLATKVYRSIDLEEYRVIIYDSNYPGVDMPAKFKRITDYNPYSSDSRYEFSYAYDNSSIIFTSFLYAGSV